LFSRRPPDAEIHLPQVLSINLFKLISGSAGSTVSAAVRLLRERGLLYARARLGTFVAREIPPE